MRSILVRVTSFWCDDVAITLTLVQIQSDAESDTDPPDAMLCTGFLLLKADALVIQLLVDWQVCKEYVDAVS